MKKNENKLPDEKFFWDKKYGAIYYHLENSTPYKKLVNDLLSRVEINQNAYILDAGAGSGYLLGQLLLSTDATLLAKIDVLDISSTQLNYLRKRLELLSTSISSKVEFLEHDLSYSTPFLDESFDIIFSNLVLSYIVHFKQRYGEAALVGVLTEMYRLLKRGGTFCWSTPVKNVRFYKVFLASWQDLIDIRHLSRLYYGPQILRYALTIQKKGAQGVYHFYSSEKIKQILHEIGFQEISIMRSFASQAYVIVCKK